MTPAQRFGPQTPTRRAGRWLEELVAGHRVIEGRRSVDQRECSTQYSVILQEGMLSRALNYRDGKRQVVSVHVPGDFIHFYAGPARHQETVAITRCRVALIPNCRLDHITRQQPDRLRDLWTLAAADAAVCRAWLFRLGRLDAVARIAHFLSEMNYRLAASGRSDGRKFQLALTQADLAEICGLTPVHVNRVMRRLREMGLCTFRSFLVEISERTRLEAVGQFNCSYLEVGNEHDRPVAPVAGARLMHPMPVGSFQEQLRRIDRCQ
ncbi:Crp/Fnr family transcriptional regulator [Novosphingobium sp.]|uniref:Crp/Fnr family transcriptional regulator n=1 Tax=Novosphingobium sp. TaxID=1874826 RepID=UPI0028A61965|nr:Crp/Fnr family transcriptional regulator [Novosphingobium sp.]